MSLAESTVLLCFHSVWMRFLILCHIVITLFTILTCQCYYASFLLNGKEHVSRSNTITVDKTFELKLKGIHNEGESETIGYKPSVDAVADNLQELVDSYNSIIDIATNPVGEEQQGNRLLNDMRSVT